MPNSPGRFRAAVGAGWALLGLAAVVYARMKSIPAWAALPMAAAFLIEYPFYLLPAFAPERLRKPWLLMATCAAPYLVYSVATGEFRWAAFAVLLGILAVVCFWYELLPKSAATDVAFLIAMASIELTKVFDWIYLSPVPKIQMSTLGHVMLIRTAAIAMLAIRRGAQFEYRFFPNALEWKVGLRWFLIMLPVMAAALWAMKSWNLRPNPNPWLAVGEFFGILWVVALSEEMFFRGLIQQWLEQWTRNWAVALIVASALFGLVHVFHYFPNWRYTAVAGILGVFCGLAWRETRTIQSGMVTHALAATIYRVFFQ